MVLELGEVQQHPVVKVVHAVSHMPQLLRHSEPGHVPALHEVEHTDDIGTNLATDGRVTNRQLPGDVPLGRYVPGRVAVNFFSREFG